MFFNIVKGGFGMRKLLAGYAIIAAVLLGGAGLIFAGYSWAESSGVQQGEGCFGGSCSLKELNKSRGE